MSRSAGLRGCLRSCCVLKESGRVVMWVVFLTLVRNIHLSSVQFLSHTTPWTAAPQASLSIANSRSLAQTHIHQVDDAIQGDVVPFSSCFQSFPASGSFSMSQFFALGGQSIGASLEKGMPSHFSILALRTPWTVWTGRWYFLLIFNDSSWLLVSESKTY